MASVHPPPRKAIGSLTVSYRIRTLHTCTPALILSISSPMTTSVATDSSCASLSRCHMNVHVYVCTPSTTSTTITSTTTTT